MQVGKDGLRHFWYIDPVESEVRRLVRLKPVHHLPQSGDATQTFVSDALQSDILNVCGIKAAACFVVVGRWKAGPLDPVTDHH